MPSRPNRRVDRPVAPYGPVFTDTPSSALILQVAPGEFDDPGLTDRQLLAAWAERRDLSVCPEDPTDEILVSWWDGLSPTDKARVHFELEFGIEASTGVAFSDTPFELLKLDQFDDNGFLIPKGGI